MYLCASPRTSLPRLRMDRNARGEHPPGGVLDRVHGRGGRGGSVLGHPRLLPDGAGKRPSLRFPRWYSEDRQASSGNSQGIGSWGILQGEKQSFFLTVLDFFGLVMYWIFCLSQYTVLLIVSFNGILFIYFSSKVTWNQWRYVPFNLYSFMKETYFVLIWIIFFINNKYFMKVCVIHLISLYEINMLDSGNQWHIFVFLAGRGNIPYAVIR